VFHDNTSRNINPQDKYYNGVLQGQSNMAGPFDSASGSLSHNGMSECALAHKQVINVVQTKVTTRFTISKPSDKPRRQKNPVQPNGQSATPVDGEPRAMLVLKTYDPVSGIVLKYQTDRAAEVGRLVAAMGTCARKMAALKDAEKTENPEDDADGMVGVIATGTALVKDAADKAVEIVRDSGKDAGKGKTGGSGGGGGGKKKKGKR
jgi:hypothetical protein